MDCLEPHKVQWRQIQTPVPWMGQTHALGQAQCRESCMGKKGQWLGSPRRHTLTGCGDTAHKRGCCNKAKMAHLVPETVVWPKNRLHREAMGSPSWVSLFLLALALCGVDLGTGWGPVWLTLWLLAEVQTELMSGTTGYFCNFWLQRLFCP